MNYHINRNGEDLGRFTLDEIREGLKEGQFHSDDLAWRSGMDTWETLRELKDLYQGNAVQPGEGVSTSTAHGSTDSERVGPPWEQKESGTVWSRTWGTIKGALFQPSTFFQTMRREGGIGQPLLFYVLWGTVFGIIGQLLMLPFQLMGLTIPQPGMGGDEHVMEAAAGTAGIIMALIFTIIILPFAIAIGSFIAAGINHVALMIVGGARQPFEATFRTVCYAGGSSQFFQIIPICGAIVGGIWNLVILVIGFKETHEISTGKALLGVFLPVIICCGLIVGIYLLIGGAMFAAMAAN